MSEKDIKIEASSGARVTTIFINKLVIEAPGVAKYTPSTWQRIKQVFGLSDYNKDVRSVLDNMGLKNVPLLTGKETKKEKL